MYYVKYINIFYQYLKQNKKILCHDSLHTMTLYKYSIHHENRNLIAYTMQSMNYSDSIDVNITNKLLFNIFNVTDNF